jgi:hypothetical protein
MQAKQAKNVRAKEMHRHACLTAEVLWCSEKLNWKPAFVRQGSLSGVCSHLRGTSGKATVCFLSQILWAWEVLRELQRGRKCRDVIKASKRQQGKRFAGSVVSRGLHALSVREGVQERAKWNRKASLLTVYPRRLLRMLCKPRPHAERRLAFCCIESCPVLFFPE